jgi:hypothetical protein
MRVGTFLRQNRVEVLAAVLLLLTCVYAVLNRTLYDLLVYPALIAAVTVFAGHGMLMSHWVIGGARPLNRKMMAALFLYVPGGAIGCGIIYYAGWVALKDGYFWLQTVVPPRAFAYVVTPPAVLIVGYVLFSFRAHARFFYGLTEALVGVSVAILRVPAAGGDPFAWDSTIYLAMLTAGVFLVVRGFDNMQSGLKPDSYDSILKELQEREARMLKNWTTRDSVGRDEAIKTRDVQGPANRQ